jgi:hypothetical protein
MGALLPSHVGRAVVVPPRELIDPHVEITPNHWFWLLEFHETETGPTAVFPWTAPAENSTRYVVARLLWCWDNDGFGIKRLRLENTCGLATCINPRHWRYVKDLASRKFMLVAGSDARLFSYAHAAEEGSKSIHIVPHEAYYTMCGASLRRLVTSREKIITCEDCLSEWRAYGRPLEEVHGP